MEGLDADKKLANELFDHEDMVGCLALRQKILAQVLANPESSLSDKIEAHVSVAKVFATSMHHIKEMTKEFQNAVELGAAANDVPLICSTLTRLAYTLFRAMQPDAALSQFQVLLLLFFFFFCAKFLCLNVFFPCFRDRLSLRKRSVKVTRELPTMML